MSMGTALILAIAPLFALFLLRRPSTANGGNCNTGSRSDQPRSCRPPCHVLADWAKFPVRRCWYCHHRIGPRLNRKLCVQECDFSRDCDLCALALVALSYIRSDEIDYARARNASATDGGRFQNVGQLIRNRSLIVFVVCLMIFQFADASTVPLLSQEIGKSKAANSSLQISGLIISAQLW